MSESETPPVDWQDILYKAAESGDIKKAQEALDHGAGIDSAGESQLEQALRCAVWRGHLDFVRFLLEKGAQVNKKQEDGETALFGACWTGNLEAAQLLIQAGAEVNIASRYGVTPLMRAAGRGDNLKLVQLLVEHGANIQAKDHWKADAAYQAIKDGNPEIAKFLVERGNLHTGYALQYAVRHGRANIAETMLKLGANKHLESCKKALESLEEKSDETSLKLRDLLEAVLPDEREKRLQAEHEEQQKAREKSEWISRERSRVTRFDFASCPICQKIPAQQFADIANGEKLSEAVELLDFFGGSSVLGGNVLDSLKKCPICDTVYGYSYDHDSEAGFGPGWTEESIKRITREAAVEELERLQKKFPKETSILEFLKLLRE